MTKPVSLLKKLFLICIAILLVACQPQAAGVLVPVPAASTPTSTAAPTYTPFPKHPEYNPGELVDYVAQAGDTLPALAAHFNTSIAKIRAANEQIPADATTMPPSMPMKIPIYYLPFWGTQVQIVPDSQYVNGPAAVGFDTSAFVSSHPGWLKDYRAYVEGDNHTGAEIVDIVAINYSVSPRVLLAILDFAQAGVAVVVAHAMPVVPAK